MFCSNCGAEISEKAVICVKCGVPTAARQQCKEGSSADWLTAVLLCFFFGWLGVHRFYTKSAGLGIAQLLLGIFSCFIVSIVWSFVDLILLLCGNYKTGDGQVLKHGGNT